ncbi:MAG: alpha/beta hydrolase [Treponema sp.]|nr:alpha/beta hydrolase [Treponema sp.]
MTGWAPAVIAAAVVLLLAAGFWFRFLPDYLFGFTIKRKAPIPGSPAHERLEIEAARAEPRLWIDTMPYEKAGIMSHDGLALEGWFLACPGGKSGKQQDAAGIGSFISDTTMILAHGYSGHPRQLNGIAQGVYEHLGYNILLPSARGYGDSQGEYIGFGWLDRLDYLRWIDWVKKRTAPSGPVNIVLYGISMGGATVLATGGENLPPEVKAIISDCSFTSLYEELWHLMKRRCGFRNKGLLKRISGISKRRAGYSFEDASVLNQVKKITLPAFFIHGGADTFVPFEMGRALYEACSAPKEFYTAQGAGHGEACGSNPEEYRRRITQFLRKYNL